MTDAAHKAFSFAACEAIAAGAWDEHLHLIYRQIKARQATQEYKAKLRSRTEFRAGTEAHPYESGDHFGLNTKPCKHCGQGNEAPIHRGWPGDPLRRYVGDRG